jgi:hypothetical protein
MGIYGTEETMIQRRVYGLLLGLLLLGFGCGGDGGKGNANDRQPVAELEQRSMAGSVATVTMETLSVTRYDTIRTITFDTVRTVVYDTVRVEQHVTVYDTMRTVTLVPELEQAPPPAKTLDPQELAAMKDGLSQGRMSEKTLAAIVGKTPEFSTVSFTQLDSIQADLIAHAFGFSGASIQSFRWGPYPAGESSDLAGKTFLTVWLGDPKEKREKVLVVDAAGQIAKK